jgi:hypothetical protein
LAFIVADSFVSAELNIPVRAKKWPLSKKERSMMDLSKGFKSQYHQGGALIMKFKQSDGRNQRFGNVRDRSFSIVHKGNGKLLKIEKNQFS